MDENLEDMNLESAFDQEPDEEDFEPDDEMMLKNYRLVLQGDEARKLIFILAEGKDEDDAWNAIYDCLNDRLCFQEQLPLEVDWAFYCGHYGLEEDLMEYYKQYHDELRGKWSYERYEIRLDTSRDLLHCEYDICLVEFPEDGDAEHIIIEKVENE